ncbi:MAG: hypothetical protein IKL29_07230, partial [Bacteroidaceae bacterium]|nr:hypothetical protein [Bacteroidaceae bacterium]
KLFIYKDPKTDEGNLKKSHKGCCRVTKNDDGLFSCEDENYAVADEADTEMKTVFVDGVMQNVQAFLDIRKVLYG